MPTHFWNDADGRKYKNAYFNKFPGNICFDRRAYCTQVFACMREMNFFGINEIQVF